MYKHQIKSLVLATVIGFGTNLHMHAGDNNRSSSFNLAWTFVGVVVGILGCQSIYHGIVAKEAKLLDNANNSFELFIKDGRVVRDQNVARTVEIFGSGYTDEDLKVLKVSNRVRKAVAFNRDKVRKDDQYTDFKQTVAIIKQEKAEKLKQQSSGWSWWPFGKKN